MVFNWLEGEEPFTMRCVGVCPDAGDDVGHAHMEICLPDGQFPNGQDRSALAGFTITLRDCRSLAWLLEQTGNRIEELNEWSTAGIEDLEQHANALLS